MSCKEIFFLIDVCIKISEKVERKYEIFINVTLKDFNIIVSYCSTMMDTIQQLNTATVVLISYYFCNTAEI